MAKNRQFIRQGGKKGGFRNRKEEELEDQMQGQEPIENEEEDFLDMTMEVEQAQDFFEKHQNTILGIAAAIVLLLGAYFAYKYMYQAPRQEQAMDAIQKAQYQFERDSFTLALENPGSGYEGFLDIIENHSGTKQANLAKYYAGISYLNLGNYESAINFLEGHNPTDLTGISKYGAIADANAELGNMEAALSNYKKAATQGNNEMLTPYYLMKLGVLQMKQGDNSGAKATFAKIVSDFPKSAEKGEAEKFGARIQ